MMKMKSKTNQEKRNFTAGWTGHSLRLSEEPDTKSVPFFPGQRQRHPSNKGGIVRKKRDQLGGRRGDNLSLGSQLPSCFFLLIF